MGARGVILVSDKRARLKPCLRCGYSLVHIAGARNCPECGLAVRISIGGNSALEWSNPRWQRWVAVAFTVLAAGLACTVVRYAVGWILEWSDYELETTTFQILEWINRVGFGAAPILNGVALCLLSRGERRYPEQSQPVRAIALVAGLLLIAMGLFNVLVRYGYFRWRFAWYYLWQVRRGPWIPLVLAILTCTYALGVAKRGHSRVLRRLCQLPLWSAAAGLVVWFFRFDRLIWWLPSLLSDALFPLATILVLVIAIRLLLSHAREAEANWVSDP